MSKKTLVAIASLCAAVSGGLLGACGGHTSTQPQTSPETKEVSPSGDIPDNQAFVPFTPATGGFTVKVPEGWSRRDEVTATVFTDKLNTIRIENTMVPAPPTPASIRQNEWATLPRAGNNVRLGGVEVVERHAGPATLTTYGSDSAPDPVTGKTIPQASERYQFWKSGQQVTLTLSAPKAADNKDPWRTVTDSFAWSA